MPRQKNFRKKRSAQNPAYFSHFSDGLATSFRKERCGDDSGDGLVSQKTAGVVALKRIAICAAVDPDRLLVAVQKNDEAASFTFSMTWIAPSTVLNLIAGRLTPRNIKCLVASDEMAREDLLLYFLVPNLHVNADIFFPEKPCRSG